MIYAIRGLRRLPKGSSLATQNVHLGLALVGLCSGLFHALLKFHSQMGKILPPIVDTSLIDDLTIFIAADETSMIVATACVLHRAMTFRQSTNFTRVFTSILLVAVTLETAYHIRMDEQTVHELSFAFLIVCVAIKTRSLIKERVKASEDRAMLQKMSIFGICKSDYTCLFLTETNQS